MTSFSAHRTPNSKYFLGHTKVCISYHKNIGLKKNFLITLRSGPPLLLLREAAKKFFFLMAVDYFVIK